MAATVSKVTPAATPPTARKNRVARVSAKRPKRDSDKDETEHEPDDVELESEEVAEKPSRPDNGTYLSMYFRDMAVLDVLRPEEEFTSAREIESLEIMLWEAVLAHAPAVDHVLASVEVVMEGLPPE